MAQRRAQSCFPSNTHNSCACLPERTMTGRMTEQTRHQQSNLLPKKWNSLMSLILITLMKMMKKRTMHGQRRKKGVNKCGMNSISARDVVGPTHGKLRMKSGCRNESLMILSTGHPPCVRALAWSASRFILVRSVLTR